MTKRGRFLLLVFAVLAAVLIAVWRARTSPRVVAPVASSVRADVDAGGLLDVASGPSEAPIASRAAVGEVEPRAEEPMASPAATDQGLDVTWPSHGDEAFVVGIVNRALDVRDAKDDLVRHASEPDHVVRIRGLVPRAVYSIAPIVDGRPSFALAQEVVLEPGEIRELVLAAPRELRGVLIDADGAPIAQCIVWLAEDDDARGYYFFPCRKLIAQVETDAAGRFSFRDVAPGAWVAGPGFAGTSADDRCWQGKRPEACAAPVPTHVIVAGEDVDVVLRGWRGLFVRGSALLASGEPCIRCYLTATNLDSGLEESGATDESGAFVIGPLEAGAFRLELYGGVQGSRGAASTAQAWAGDTGVMLRLDAGLSMSVTCALPAAAQGRVQVIDVTVHRVDPVTGAVRLAGGEGSKHRTKVFRGLEPGDYSVTATVDGQLFGVLTGIRVSSDAPELAVTVPLEPAARGEVLVRGDRRWVYLRVDQRGGVVFEGLVRVGTAMPATVCPGPVHVELRDKEGGAQVLLSGTFAFGAAGEPLVIDLDR